MTPWGDAIPDMAGTVLAARAWCYFDGRLFPIFSGAQSTWATFGLWFLLDPGELADQPWADAEPQTAECHKKSGTRHEPTEPVPATSCMCGFWGLTDPAELVTVLGLQNAHDGRSRKLGETKHQPVRRRRLPSFVLGTVRMWGRIIPGAVGWRSSDAQIDGIIAGSHPDARKIARRYGVPTLATWPELTPAWEKR